jgi:hypothetical protein
MFFAGADKASQCKLCVSNLDEIHEALLLARAKFEKIQPDDLATIEKFKDDILHLNQKAEDHMDAAKLVKNKLRNFLAAQ